MISPKDLASIRVRFAEQPHGTRHRYLGGCRCVPCRANSRYSCERAAAQRAGDLRGFVWATLVLGHIQELRKAGIGYKAIAAAAGLAKSTQWSSPGGGTDSKASCGPHPGRGSNGVADYALAPANRSWMLLDELLDGGLYQDLLAKSWAAAPKRQLHIQAERITALTASKVERLHRRLKEGPVSR